MGCRTRQNEVGQQPKASAIEVFQLRTECANLSRKVLADKESMLQPTTEVKSYAWWHGTSERSHYDPKTNRCYSEITTNTTDRAGSGYEAFSIDLYDAQTAEFLAHTRKQVARGKYPAEKDTGMIYVESDETGQDPYKRAADYIENRMKDDRK